MEGGRQYQLSGNTLEKIKLVRKWSDKICIERTCERFAKSSGGSRSSIKNYIRISRRPAIMVQLLDRPTLPLSKILTLMKLKDHEIDSKIILVFFNRPLKVLQQQVFLYLRTIDQNEGRGSTLTSDFTPAALAVIFEEIQDYLSIQTLEQPPAFSARSEPGAKTNGAFELVATMSSLREGCGVVELFGVKAQIPFPIDLISSVDRRTADEVKRKVENRAVKVAVRCESLAEFTKSIVCLQRYIAKKKGESEYEFN